MSRNMKITSITIKGNTLYSDYEIIKLASEVEFKRILEFEEIKNKVI